ncbi:MAG: YdcF family protein [Ruminococcus sp.]|nr:YdcF family protein [Ruminococcus sp.]
MEVKIIPAVMSFAVFLLFFLPMPMGILNIGNFFGMAVSGILTVIFIFFGRFKSLVSALWKYPTGRAGLCVLSVLTAVFFAYAVIISVCMAREITDTPKNENTTVIVLGCKVKDGRPSLMLKRRLEKAYEYLSEHKGVKAIVSGGQGSDEMISEAQCMRDWLVEKGISEERILMEDSSSSTEENLKFSREIIKSRNLPTEITLITDGFHQYRAELIAVRTGFDRENIKNLSGYTSWYITPTYWLRELFGIAYYKIKK